jgi:hypothetical protein
MKRLLIVLSPSEFPGGAEFYCLDLVKGLKQFGQWECKILVSHNRSFLSFLERHDVPFSWLGSNLVEAT